MPAPLMVPSKDALRLLRQIAFASSAGVAFASFSGVALLVEIRRRQICAVEERLDNAKKIRSCRKYHSIAVVQDGDQLFSPEYETDRVIDLRWSEEPATTQIPHSPLQRRKTNLRNEEDSRDAHLLVPEGKLFSGAAAAKFIPHRGAQSRTQAHERVSTLVTAFQDAVIYQVDKSLALGNIKEAVGKFFAAFYHNRYADARISDTARRLSAACKETNNLVLANKVNQKLAELGLISRLRRGNNRLEEGIEKLLAESRIEEAVATFLARTRGKNITIDEGAMKAIDSLHLATLRAKQWSLTNAIFWRLYSLGYKDFLAWSRLFQVYDERKQYRGVVSLYKRFLGHFEPNHIVLAIVLRAFIAQLRLSEAETLLRSALKPPWLPLRSCFTILLGGVWRVTKDLQRTIELFGWMETWFPRYRPSVALFNTMIQACVEAGRNDGAEFYVQLMKEMYGLRPNVKTHAHLLLAKAKVGDWRGVKVILRKIHEDGLELTQNNASSFNPLLIEFSRTRTPNDIENFLLSAIENYGIIPDLNTFNIISNIYVRAGDLKSLARLVETMKMFGLQPNATTFNTAFHELWRETKVNHAELYRMCSEIQGTDGALVNERTKNTIRHAIAHDYRKGHLHTTRYLKVKSLVGQKPNSRQQQDLRSVHLSMVAALSQERMGKKRMANSVLQLYHNAKASGMQISPEMVETAFQASLLKGGSVMGKDLVRSARRAGVDSDTLLPVVISNMSNKPIEVKHLPDLLRRVYHKRSDRGLDIKHHVSVAAASQLIQSRRSHAAVDLLTRVMQSEWGKRKPLDIVGMSVLLKAYMSFKNEEGVRQVVGIVLSQRMRIDTPFIRVLEEAVALLGGNKTTRREETSGHLEKVANPLSSLVKDCMARRKEQTGERRRKCETILNIFSGKTAGATESVSKQVPHVEVELGIGRRKNGSLIGVVHCHNDRATVTTQR
ncbi:hypothetical protein FGG08_005622 [Glutinoglossum americanum]|uniref:Pentatricopeptide repeat-containing protein n=1 Tax=Glutinoglossum americanum TaxID=1670608 RepID=A0A9P8I385_9PEZI|nr:hypothetical protein FGG08_005622 [Glutinoglossum americanum]